VTRPQPADVLSAAVVADFGWGRAAMPIADEPAVADLAQREDADPAALLRGVHDAIGASDRLEVTELSASDDGREALYKRRLRAARPDLSPDAVNALASRWFFTLRWLGIEFQEMVRTRNDVPFRDTRAQPAKRRTMDAETIRATGIWVRTSDGWFASTATVAPGERPTEFFLYDRERLSYRTVPAAEVLEVEHVDAEGLYEGHWIPLVSTWKQDGTRVHAPVPRSGADYLAVLYLYRSPDWEALVALPRAEVHDERGGNGGVSFLVPLSVLSDFREKVMPL
jgi:hypothetical protein